MSRPSNECDAEKEFLTEEVIDVMNVIETVDSCESACKLVSLNVQSLSARISDIVSDRVFMMADYLAFSETWECNETTMELAGFVCIATAKRSSARVAGVAIYQNSAAASGAVPHSIQKLSASYDFELGLSDDYGDICAAEITIMNTKALLFCVYISPGIQVS